MGVDAPAVVTIRETRKRTKVDAAQRRKRSQSDLALALEKRRRVADQESVEATGARRDYKGSIGNMDEGWTRFVFDTFNVPYTSIRDVDMRQGKLNSKFDAVIFSSQAATQIINGNAAGNCAG
jgi:hypothetical protein